MWQMFVQALDLVGCKLRVDDGRHWLALLDRIASAGPADGVLDAAA